MTTAPTPNVHAALAAKIQEKTARIVALQRLQKRVQGELYAAAVGRLEPVLVDSRSRRRDWELSGRTSGNTVVNLPGSTDWVGRPTPSCKSNPSPIPG